jgi:hypothetical protein
MGDLKASKCTHKCVHTKKQMRYCEDGTRSQLKNYGSRISNVTCTCMYRADQDALIIMELALIAALHQLITYKSTS